MDALTHKAHINDLHIPHIRFGGDVFLKPGTEGLAQEITEEGKGQREGDEQESPTVGSGASKRGPGKSRGEKRSGGEVGAASWMDGESAFAGAESRQRFIQ